MLELTERATPLNMEIQAPDLNAPNGTSGSRPSMPGRSSLTSLHAPRHVRISHHSMKPWLGTEEESPRSQLSSTTQALSPPQGPLRSPSSDLSKKWFRSRSSIQSLATRESAPPSTGTAIGAVRGARDCLLPWLTWLPVALAMLIFFMTPPLIIFAIDPAFNEDGWEHVNCRIDHGVKKCRGWDPGTWRLLSVCAIGNFIYLALRVMTICDMGEFLVFFMWSCWMGVMVYAYRNSLNRSMCVTLSVIVVGIYSVRFVMLGQELRRISRLLVSKKKRRFVDSRGGGFDLDLAYVSKRLFPIVAMGFPSECTVEAQFRNSMEEVQRFFTTRHKGHHKVYNLCIERTYSQKCFGEEFHECRFPDHNPCPLAQLITICNDMQEFQKSDPLRNVVAVHCKAGKGRTGLVISAYLLHIQKFHTAKEALHFFGKCRTFNGKGVTIPSQIRYVHHYEAIVREGRMRRPVWLRMQRLEALLPLSKEGESRFEHTRDERIADLRTAMQDCRFQIVTHEEGQIFDSKSDNVPDIEGASMRQTLRQSPRSSEKNGAPLLEGDIKIVVFHESTKLFHFWIHTAYDPVLVAQVEESCGAHVWESHTAKQDGPAWIVSFPRSELDGTHKDKGQKGGSKMPEDFRIVAVFEKPSWEQELEEHLNRDRRRAQKEALESRRKQAQERCSQAILSQISMPHSPRARSRTLIHGRDLVQDYDTMGNDTDEEEMFMSLYRGYMFRSRGICHRRHKRWCELSTTGHLHIAGHQLLVVNLADGGETVIQPIADKEATFKVRNPSNNQWEVLEAEPSEAKHWDQAISDALRLGVANRNMATAFCGFFWKLNNDADEADIEEEFRFDEWRVRLFVLQHHGHVLVYSWKDQCENVFADFSDPMCSVEKLTFTWPNMPHTVPFQIVSPGEKPRVLAAREEDFELFIALWARVRSEVCGLGCSAMHLPDSAGRDCGGSFDREPSVTRDACVARGDSVKDGPAESNGLRDLEHCGSSIGLESISLDNLSSQVTRW